MDNSSTTTQGLLAIQFHVDSGACVAVEGQDIQESNLLITSVYMHT